MRDLCTDLKYRTHWKLRAAEDMCMTGGPDPILVGYGAIPFPWTWHLVNVPAEKQRQRHSHAAIPRDPVGTDDYTHEYDLKPVKRVKLVPVKKWWIPEEEKPRPSEGIEQQGWTWQSSVAERFHEPSGLMQYVGYHKASAGWAWAWGKNGRYTWHQTGYLSSSEAMADAEAAAKIIEKAWLP